VLLVSVPEAELRVAGLGAPDLAANSETQSVKPALTALLRISPISQYQRPIFISTIKSNFASKTFGYARIAILQKDNLWPNAFSYLDW
jgi:hypothetical protein